MRPPFFPMNDPKDVMNRYILIAVELGFYPPDDMPIYRFQQLSDFAHKRRKDRLEAAKNGLVFTG